MTSVNLPEALMIELIHNIKRSQSLHCVHLCGNRLNEEQVDFLHNKLKPTIVNEMALNEKK